MTTRPRRTSQIFIFNFKNREAILHALQVHFLMKCISRPVFLQLTTWNYLFWSFLGNVTWRHIDDFFLLSSQFHSWTSVIDWKIDPFTLLNAVSNSSLTGLRFSMYCISIIMWHLYLNDMKIPESKSFIPRGFELDTTWVSRFGLLERILHA